MSDIRKRVGKKGTTYQVRYPSKNTKSGYAYATFDTMKEARAFVESGKARERAGTRGFQPIPVQQAIEKWLEVCEFEGRDGKDPVSPATLDVYRGRAEIMQSYDWTKDDVRSLETPDIVEFRSWLLRSYSRDQAKKVLSSFHSVILEMVTQGVMTNDPAAKISVQQSRYKEPVDIPSVAEVQEILRAADRLANHRNYWISKAWERYRPMIYLAADTGLRPQEYLALPQRDLLEKGIRVTQALSRSNRIEVPKSPASRRYLPVCPDTLDMTRHYVTQHNGDDLDGLVYPAENGGHQRYNNFLRRGWHTLMAEAGLVEEKEVDGKTQEENKYTPYSMRHFYASMLIANNKDLKTIQERMGHKDAAMTLNIYGHVIKEHRAKSQETEEGILASIL